MKVITRNKFEKIDYKINNESIFSIGIRFTKNKKSKILAKKVP